MAENLFSGKGGGFASDETGKISSPSTFERIGLFGLARSRGHRPPEETLEEEAVVLEEEPGMWGRVWRRVKEEVGRWMEVS